MLVLGIETSCDETGLALVADGRQVLGTQLASSLPHHQRYGGVVPEIASRAHVELLTVELESLLTACHVSPEQIDRIAVTCGPGLAGALLVGVAAAKALALAWGKEITGINHLQAHLYAALMAPPPAVSDEAGFFEEKGPFGPTSGGGVENPQFPLDAPMIGLVVSGGHTAIVRMDGIRRFRLLGQTRDDAVGEAFDKVAKLLGLGFPGGPEIEKVAQRGNPRTFRFSVPRIKGGSPYDFSLSGIKTAVLYKTREWENHSSAHSEFVADLAASFQHAVVEEVVGKTIVACRENRIHRLVLGGGVVANGSLRERFREVCAEHAIRLACPSLGLCTDNGAMVAGLGCHALGTDPVRLTAVPDLRVEVVG